MGTPIQSHLALLYFSSCYVFCFHELTVFPPHFLFFLGRSGKLNVVIVKVSIFICITCPASTLVLIVFLALMQISWPFPCLSGANEARVTFVPFCHFRYSFASLTGESRDVTTECVRTMVRGKRG